jgi:hypothetical protein
MAPKRDVKQWKQACREIGLTPDEQRQAKRDFHADKRASGDRDHRSYGNLIIWLQDWREDRWWS